MTARGNASARRLRSGVWNVRFAGGKFITTAALLGATSFGITLAWAQTSLGWPETIELLAQERTQAETCVETLKSSGDKAAVATGRLTYGTAKSQADGVIAGLTIALVQGGQPDGLPRVLASLKKAGAGLREVCDAALKSCGGDQRALSKTF
jgi:hypothetical protein